MEVLKANSVPDSDCHRRVERLVPQTKRDPVRSGVPSPRYVGCIRQAPTSRTGRLTPFGKSHLMPVTGGPLWNIVRGRGAR